MLTHCHRCLKGFVLGGGGGGGGREYNPKHGNEM